MTGDCKLKDGTYDRATSSTGDSCTTSSTVTIFTGYDTLANCKAAPTATLTLKMDGKCNQLVTGGSYKAVCGSAAGVAASFVGVVIALAMATVV